MSDRGRRRGERGAYRRSSAPAGGPERGEESMKRTWFGRVNVVVLAIVIALAGCADACNGCGSKIGEEAAKHLTKTVDNFVNQMPSILKQIDSLIENNLDQVGEEMARQIQEVNKLLRENIDGINGA